MNTNGQNQGGALRELLTTPGPCITIALAGSEMGDMATELKNALNTVRERLKDSSVDIESLLEPVQADGLEFRGAAKFRGAMVILRSPSLTRVYRPPTIQPLVRVSTMFDVRTILSAIDSERTFYILALSQNRTRILKCTNYSVEELPFPEDFPSSLVDSKQTRKPDHNLKGRSSGGPSMGGGAVMFGTSSDGDIKDEYLFHFFSDVDRAVHATLKDSTEPLIPFGVEHEVAPYRRVSTYGNLVEPGVYGAPDGLDTQEMHRRALELLQRRDTEPGLYVPADFDKRVGTGHASTHIHDIVTAAHDGRVSHLFFQSNAEYLGTFDPVRRRVKRTTDPIDGPVDLVEMAAYQTIVQGGVVRILSSQAMPAGVPVCALFRYPANQTAGATQSAEDVEVSG